MSAKTLVFPSTGPFKLPSFVLLVIFGSIIYCAAVDVACHGDHSCVGGSKCVQVTVGSQTKKVCVCKPGTTGWNCSEPLDYCNKHCRPPNKGVTCQQVLCNQGKCINQEQPPYYICDCGAFYTGENCQLENNPCTSSETNPCVNGKCVFVKGTNQVVCDCYSGWSANPNQQITNLDWGGTTIHVAPPCTEQVKRGLTDIAPHLTANAKVFWSLIFFLSFVIFVWLTASTWQSYPRHTEQSVVS